MNLYVKKGRKNYKEQKMLNKLEKLIQEKSKQNPDFGKDIIPARNESELKAMFDRYVPQDVKFTETKTPTMAKTKEAETNIETPEFDEQVNDDSTFVDPFNRENPIVRDYVLGQDALGREAIKGGVDPDARFSEPTNFDEAFTIPDPDGDEDNEKPKSNSKPNSGGSRQGGEKFKKQEQPANPNWDDMASGKKKRSARKFAQYLVEAVCLLAQKGFVWFTTKDINPAKLAEYELTGEIDLSLLLTLDDGQQVTIKEFFQSQCLLSEQLSHIKDEQKKDMTDSLTEVLIEKGAAPTPTQELLLVVGTVIGGQVITAIALNAQTKSLLNQLKGMKNGEIQSNEPIENEVADRPIPEPQPEPTPVRQEQTNNFEDIDRVVEEATEYERVIETIE
jgi:hypothetical protein